MKRNSSPIASLLIFLVAIMICGCNMNDIARQKKSTVDNRIDKNAESGDASGTQVPKKDITGTDTEQSVTLSVVENEISKSPAAEETREIDDAHETLSPATVISPSSITTKNLGVTDVHFTPTVAGSSSAMSAEGFYKSIVSDAPGTPFHYEEPKAVTIEKGSPSSAHHATNINLAGQLTAGEINDFQKWKMWGDIADDELRAYRDIWSVNPEERFSIMVSNQYGSPIADCKAELISKDGLIVWTAKSDNTGKAELWNQFDMQLHHKNPDKIRVSYQGITKVIERPHSIGQGTNTVTLKTECNHPDAVDLLFTVDATGSMQDEIEYLQAELVDVMNKVKSGNEDLAIKLGSVFYRDHGDTYVTISTPLSSDISQTSAFISNQYADGGGDGPEAVDDALEASLNEINWSTAARARLMFLILDAPPHADAPFIEKMKKSIRLAAEKGVRIIPIVASGGGYDIDKSLEYLMRCCALATNGTYAFLTDHSGIGGTHTAPSTDKYEVETLNALLIRIIEQFIFMPDCDIEQFVMNEQPQDTASVTEDLPMETWVENADSTGTDSLWVNLHPNGSLFTLKCFPNPATDYIWAETSELVQDLYIADNSGKIIQRINPTALLTRLDLTGYPTGIYYLKAWINEKWASAKIIVTHL